MHNFGFLYFIQNHHQKLTTIHNMKPVKKEWTYWMTPKRKYHHIINNFKLGFIIPTKSQLQWKCLFLKQWHHNIVFKDSQNNTYHLLFLAWRYSSTMKYFFHIVPKVLIRIPFFLTDGLHGSVQLMVYMVLFNLKIGIQI